MYDQLISEARELCEKGSDEGYDILAIVTRVYELCDALEKTIAERDTYKSALQNWHEEGKH